MIGENDELDGDIESKGDKIADAIAAMSEGLNKMAESIAAPKKIIRDKAGKIIGAEPVKEIA